MAQLQSTSITGSLIVTGGITGSLFGTSSYAITASYALNAGDSVWTSSGNNIYYNTGNVGISTTSPVYKLDVSGSISAFSIDAPQRYNIASYTFVNNSLVISSSFFGPITSYGNFNPNYQNIYTLESYISYLYIDIVNNNTNITYKNLRFANKAAIVTYVSNLGITDGRLNFYAYRNDTSTFNIGGSNQFSTFCTFLGTGGKIASKRKINKRIEFASKGTQALCNYLTGSFYNTLATELTNPSNIITDAQVDAIVNSQNICFINFDKYKDRKKSGLYINMAGFNMYQNPIVSGSSYTMINASPQTKIIATALLRISNTINPTSGDIFMEHASKTHNDSLSFAPSKVYANASYINVYVIQDTTNNGRGLAVEFLNIDAVSIPFNSKISPIPNYQYFFKKGNQSLINISSSANTSGTRTDFTTRTDFLQINSLFPTSNTLRPYKEISIIRLYENGTCDVFDKCLKIVSTTYSSNINGLKKKFYYSKLNKRP